MIEGKATIVEHSMGPSDGVDLIETNITTVEAGSSGLTALWFDLPKV